MPYELVPENIQDSIAILASNFNDNDFEALLNEIKSLPNILAREESLELLKTNIPNRQDLSNKIQSSINSNPPTIVSLSLLPTLEKIATLLDNETTPEKARDIRKSLDDSCPQNYDNNPLARIIQCILMIENVMFSERYEVTFGVSLALQTAFLHAYYLLSDDFNDFSREERAIATTIKEKLKALHPNLMSKLLDHEFDPRDEFKYIIIYRVMSVISHPEIFAFPELSFYKITPEKMKELTENITTLHENLSKTDKQILWVMQLLVCDPAVLPNLPEDPLSKKLISELYLVMRQQTWHWINGVEPTWSVTGVLSDRYLEGLPDETKQSPLYQLVLGYRALLKDDIRGVTQIVTELNQKTLNDQTSIEKITINSLTHLAFLLGSKVDKDWVNIGDNMPGDLPEEEQMRLAIEASLQENYDPEAALQKAIKASLEEPHKGNSSSSSISFFKWGDDNPQEEEEEEEEETKEPEKKKEKEKDSRESKRHKPF